MKGKRIALVYDWFDKKGGAERLFEILLEIFPEADVFTSFWDKEKIEFLKGRRVRQSFISTLPHWLRSRRKLLALVYPLAFESFVFDDYDYVISITSYFAKSVITKPGTKHLCYLFTPVRFLWRYEKEYLGKKRLLASPILAYLRQWDYLAAKRPDKYIFLSDFVKKQAEKYYGISGDVLYPAFDFDYWKRIKAQIEEADFSKFRRLGKGFILFVGRLEPYKRIDLLLEIARRMRRKKFVVVGTGSLRKKLLGADLANLYFFEDTSDLELGYLYQKAGVLLMPQSEEFGYTALESLFFQTPVVYFKDSGTAEIVGECGLGVQGFSVPEFENSIEKACRLSYNLKTKIRAQRQDLIRRFSKERFKKQLFKVLQSL